jgi:hypothetical protein
MATAFNHIPASAKIDNNGGEATRQQYAGVTTGAWSAGQLLTLNAAGTIAPVNTTAYGKLDTSADIAANATLFIGLTDRSSTADANAKVHVQRITSKTEFIAVLSNTDIAAATSPRAAADTLLNEQYELLQSTNGMWSVLDNGSSTAIGPITITQVEPNFEPHAHNDINVNMLMHNTTETSTSNYQRYNRVKFKFNGISDV